MRLTIESLLAEGATLVDAIEEAVLIVRAYCANREGVAEHAEGAPPSGTREVGADQDGSQAYDEDWSEAAHS